MKNRNKFFLLSLCLALVSLVAAPIMAQEFEETGPGEGGTIYTSLGSSDPGTLNPLISADATSSDVWGWLYPSIFTVSSQTGESEPNLPHALATGWEYDDSGTVVTITLREDAFWSDGEQITSGDFIWAVNATRSGEIDSPRTGAFETLADGTPAGGKIIDVQAPDDFTVVVTFSQPDCVAFEDINDITPVPAHIFEALYGEDLSLMNGDSSFFPDVTFGPFGELELEAGVRASYLPSQDYPDSILGYVSPSEFAQLIIPDQDITVERFRAGELAITGIPGNYQAEFRGSSEFQTYESTRNGYVFVALNNADPSDPQPGVDADGNIIEQIPHPVLGDRLVRQAITQAVPVQDMIDGILDGYAIPVATHTIPTSWAYTPELQYVFDVAAAQALLTEAGWVDHDDDESTPRICEGCLYATAVDPDFEGSELTLNLYLSSGDSQNTLWSALFTDSLAQIGISLDVQEADWGTIIVPELLGQTFDMIILAWSFGLPVDPDVAAFFAPEVDVPDAGFNMVSYYNAEVMELNERARTLPGCDPEERRELYEQIQEIIYEDVPYFFLYVNETLTAAQLDLVNWNPTDFSRTYSLDAWARP